MIGRYAYPCKLKYISCNMRRRAVTSEMSVVDYEWGIVKKLVTNNVIKNKINKNTEKPHARFQWKLADL